MNFFFLFLDRLLTFNKQDFCAVGPQLLLFHKFLPKLLNYVRKTTNEKGRKIRTFVAASRSVTSSNKKQNNLHLITQSNSNFNVLIITM